MAIATAGGILPWIVGYAVTYLLVAPNLRDSALNQVIELLEGDAATHELVGWVFYNAHLVETVVDLPVIGMRSTTYIGGDDGFSVLLYLVPMVLLIVSGFLFARSQDVSGLKPGAKAGVYLVPGYLIATLIGVVLFKITAGGATGGPDLANAILMAGLSYPVSFAGTGGAIWGFVASRAE